MYGFRQEKNMLLWEANNETVQIEPWGRDSLRVRSTAGGEIRADFLSALLPPTSVEAEITIDSTSWL